MKRKHKITLATIVSLALAFVFAIWTFAPAIGPLFGFRRTPDEVIAFVKRNNIVLLVDPVPVIKDGNGSYQDWAYAEILMRRRVAVVLWIAGIVPLGLWALRRKSEKGIDNRPVEDIVA